MQAEGVLEKANEKVSQRDQDIDRLQGSELWLQQQVTNLSRLLATETNLKDRIKKLLAVSQGLEANTDKQDLQNEIDRLKLIETRISKLQETKVVLDEEIRLLKIQDQRRAIQLDELTAVGRKLVDVQSEVDRLKPFETSANTLYGEKQVLVGEKRELEREVDRLGPFETQATALQRQDNQLQAEVNRLAPFETSTISLKKENKQLQDERLEKEHSHLEHDLNGKYQAELDKYLAIRDHEKQGRSRRGTISTYHGEKENAENGKAALSDQPRGIQTQRDKFSRDVDAKKQKIDDLESEKQTMAGTVKRLEPLQLTLQDVQGKLKRTKNDLTRLLLSEGTLNKGKAEVSQLKERISSLEKENAKLIKPMVYSQLADTHKKAIMEVEKLNEKLKNVVPQAYYAQLKSRSDALANSPPQFSMPSVPQSLALDANVPQTLSALGNVPSPIVQPPFSTIANAPQPPQFGAPLRPYSFLIAVWNGQTGKGSWTAKSSASNARCVDTR
ncbi:hypothetical protein NA56DRAFT_730020 [Hyaloscypha hepaticicola]|uniref:Uncharacterized protein n=1 Tax=Hyaloscypha hepaticicola TaxID=2082293 RepID=A0A2J6QKA6_9HELO|nr:hypothetical protein NA56DRAFT_730020 [Hyaloscypha hepaticicola]